MSTLNQRNYMSKEKTNDHSKKKKNNDITHNIMVNIINTPFPPNITSSN